MSRLFVALWPPPPVLDQLEALARPELPGVRWTARSQWHVTLRFLGNADPVEAEGALRSLRHAPVDLAVRGRMHRLGRDSFVLPVSGADSLAAAVTELTATIGRPAARRFAGHLTLARSRAIQRVAVPDLSLDAGWRADEVELVESTLTSDGSRYRSLATVVLGDSADRP